jgi:hypothetical protein
MATTVCATDPRNTLDTPLDPLFWYQVGGESYRSPLLPAKPKNPIAANGDSRKLEDDRITGYQFRLALTFVIKESLEATAGV